MSSVFRLASGVIPVMLCLSIGCASRNQNWGPSAPPQREWQWERCYEGPPRPLAEIAVLWVTSDPLALRVNSIDGVGVREASEYHLLPGYHVVLTQPVSRGNVTTTADPATAGCTLEAGTVYQLTADVTWEKADYQATYYGSSYSQRFQWSPRTQEVGSCADVARYVASDEVRAQPGERPPEHWRLAALDGPPAGERNTDSPQTLKSRRRRLRHCRGPA